jgi:hypothetical protein
MFLLCEVRVKARLSQEARVGLWLTTLQQSVISKEERFVFWSL